MASPKESQRRLRIAIAITVMIAVGEFALGIYHLTHRGPGSGITEPVSAVLLITATCLVSRAMKRTGLPISMAKRISLFLPGITIIGIISLTDFYLGVYHLTHHGLRSAIIELLSTSLLATATYLALHHWNHLRRAGVPQRRVHAWRMPLGIAFVGALILAGIAYAAVHSPG